MYSRILAAVAAFFWSAAASAQQDWLPVADPSAVVISGKARFTVLTPALLRLEWSAHERFEDRASFAFVNRHQPVPVFEQRREGDWLVIDTGELVLRYRDSGEKFSDANLSIALTVAGQAVVWKPGMPETGNLRGTARTLDGVSGSCPLEEGLCSRVGWSLVDDSRTLLFSDGPLRWATPRPDPEAIDWYFFGYGRDYPRLLADFTKVAGRIPLPPRYAFGSWWSRYWAYSDAELRELVRGFAEHDVPLDVLVVDMDWHLEGWTGYTWNRALFPDPAGFLAWVHEQGLKTTLNLHPHDGVRKHEAAFPEFARAMGKNAKKIEHIPFDCADPRYMKAYFEILHHPLEREGVDFWWIDWQQGEKTSIPGLDPLFWLNHLHWLDMERNPQRGDLRPLNFSRWGGLGNHRYPIGFSGDTFCNWVSLAFQPYFTATAGNVGFGYWSHDIGGHQPGKVDPELYTRWVQFGVFSPVLRTHTTKNPEAERRIWKFPKPHFEAMRSAYHLRYELIPYIYTAARQCYDTGLPLCRPLYYAWPELPEAYGHPGEYLFGDDLLVAPVVQPASRLSSCAEVQVWLPPGQWVNWFTDEVYEGPTRVLLQVPLEEIPLFARAGAIIPSTVPAQRSGSLAALVLHLLPGEAGQAELYEDDGLSRGYASGDFARTRIERRLDGTTCVVKLHPAQGKFAASLAPRDVELRLHGFFPDRPVGAIRFNGEVVARRDAATPGAGWWFDADRLQFVVRVPRLDPQAGGEFQINTGYSRGAGVPVRQGLRGRVQAVADAEAIAGIVPPPDTPGAAAVRAQLLACESLDRAAVASALAWNMTLKRIREQAVDPQRATAALVRLLGLVPRVQVKPSAEGDGAVELDVTVGIQRHDALLGVAQWSGQLQLDAPEHFNLAESTDLSLGKAAVSKLLARTLKLKCTGPVQTDVLKGAIELHIDQTNLSLPLDLVIYPSVSRWWLIGPFDAPENQRLQTPFPPETRIDLAAEYPGKDDKPLRWQRVERPSTPDTDLSDEFFVEFHKHFDGQHYDAVAYAFTHLIAPREMDAALVFGSDDGIVIWLNGEEVHRHDVGRAYTPKQDRVDVRLKAGDNPLLVKVSQGGGMWGFGMHVETREGSPIPQLRVMLEGTSDPEQRP